MAIGSSDLIGTRVVPTVNFKQALIVIALTYGLLFVFSALGVLSAVISIFPSLGDVTIEGVGTIGVTAMVAVLIVSILATFAAATISEALQADKGQSKWGIYIALAIVSAIIWIMLPQFLPKEIQFIAGSAQSVFTGQFPTQALLLP